MRTTEELKDWQVTRVTNDVNGNPRYVIHFLAIADNYDDACKLAKKIGGKRFHTRTFGGGIAFPVDAEGIRRRIASLNN